jgi:hypothetical protein
LKKVNTGSKTATIAEGVLVTIQNTYTEKVAYINTNTASFVIPNLGVMHAKEKVTLMLIKHKLNIITKT